MVVLLVFNVQQEHTETMVDVKLTSGLATEQVRWRKDRDSLLKGADKLIGDMFLSAGSVSYVGPFTGVYRERIVSYWLNKCSTNQIPFTGMQELNEKNCRLCMTFIGTVAPNACSGNTML